MNGLPKVSQLKAPNAMRGGVAHKIRVLRCCRGTTISNAGRTTIICSRVATNTPATNAAQAILLNVGFRTRITIRVTIAAASASDMNNPLYALMKGDVPMSVAASAAASGPLKDHAAAAAMATYTDA